MMTSYHAGCKHLHTESILTIFVMVGPISTVSPAVLFTWKGYQLFPLFFLPYSVIPLFPEIRMLRRLSYPKWMSNVSGNNPRTIHD